MLSNQRIVVIIIFRLIIMLNGLIIMVSYGHWNFNCENHDQGEYDGRGQQTASPMLTAIMSGSLYIICQHNSSTP